MWPLSMTRSSTVSRRRRRPRAARGVSPVRDAPPGEVGSVEGELLPCAAIDAPSCFSLLRRLRPSGSHDVTDSPPPGRLRLAPRPALPPTIGPPLAPHPAYPLIGFDHLKAVRSLSCTFGAECAGGRRRDAGGPLTAVIHTPPATETA